MKPNILLLTSDQHRADCLGFAGRAIKTPHLDQLAADGTVFTACITPNPVCMPARASILTGQLPLTHGVHDNGIDLDPETGEKQINKYEDVTFFYYVLFYYNKNECLK